jgi:hypothetical protein
VTIVTGWSVVCGRGRNSAWKRSSNAMQNPKIKSADHGQFSLRDRRFVKSKPYLIVMPA